MSNLQVVYNCTQFCTTRGSSLLYFLRLHFAIIFISSKIKRNIFYFNQPWYSFFFFDTAATAAADAVAAVATAAVAAVALLMVTYFGRLISINPFPSFHRRNSFYKQARK